jgi:hypothetical protein
VKMYFCPLKRHATHCLGASNETMAVYELMMLNVSCAVKLQTLISFAPCESFISGFFPFHSDPVFIHSINSLQLKSLILLVCTTTMTSVGINSFLIRFHGFN